MNDLVDFLRGRLDEDESVARAATRGPWIVGPTFGGENNRVYVQPDGPGIDTIGTCVIAGQVSNVPQWRANAQHIARWDPARVLTEVEAKRLVIEHHRPSTWRASWDEEQDICGTCRYDGGLDVYDWPCPTMRALALPYAEHSDYREEWRP